MGRLWAGEGGNRLLLSRAQGEDGFFKAIRLRKKRALRGLHGHIFAGDDHLGGRDCERGEGGSAQ